MPCVRRWYFKLAEAMVHLGLARWNKDFDPNQPYDVLFYILRPDLIFRSTKRVGILQCQRMRALLQAR